MTLSNDKFQFWLQPPKSNFAKKNHHLILNFAQTQEVLQYFWRKIQVEWWLEKHSHASSLASGLLSTIYAVLGTFTNMRTATISFVMSACLSICMEQFGYQWRHFKENLYLTIFRRFVEKIQVLLKSDKNNGHFNEDVCYSLNSS